MKYYFRLQLLSIKRTIEDAGLTFPVAVVLFVLLYGLLFYGANQSPVYISWALLFMQYTAVGSLNNKERVEFLKQLFPNNNYALVRVIENTMITLPLVFIAAYQSAWIPVLGLVYLPFVYNRIGTLASYRQPIPTPFSRYPFEFIILFRRQWAIFFVLYVVLGIGLYFDNENLAIVLLAVYALLALNAYEIMEDELLVWNYDLSPKQFLGHKCKRGIAQMVLLCMPMVLILLLAEPQLYLKIVGILLIAVLLLVLSILMKYSTYPRKYGIMEIVMTMTAVFTLILIPYLYYYFYKKSVQSLKKYL